MDFVCLFAGKHTAWWCRCAPSPPGWCSAVGWQYMRLAACRCTAHVLGHACSICQACTDDVLWGLQRLRDYAALGVNRFSMGVQSFQQEMLAACGRSHTLKEVSAAEVSMAASDNCLHLRRSATCMSSILTGHLLACSAQCKVCVAASALMLYAAPVRHKSVPLPLWAALPGICSFDLKLIILSCTAHIVLQVYVAIDDMHAAGIQNWSLDLISGLPNLTEDVWQHSLEQAVAAQPAHISVYDLQVSHGHRFQTLAWSSAFMVICATLDGTLASAQQAQPNRPHPIGLVLSLPAYHCLAA